MLTTCHKQRLMQISIAICMLMAALLAGLASAQATSPSEDQQTTAATPPAAIKGANETTLKLGVYMESLCPDTRRFFLNQLVPTQEVLGQVLELYLVPFGHARTLGDNRMICQHGARECEGNRRMACLLARSQNQTQLVQTFECLFRLEDDTKTCVARHMGHVDWAELETCTSGQESYQLMVSAEKATGKLNYVPHLTLNGQSSEDIQDGAEHRLREFLCQQYKGQVQLDACKGQQQKAGSQSGSRPPVATGGDSSTTFRR